MLRPSVIIFVALFVVSEGYVDKTVYQYLVDNGYTSFVQILKESGQDKLLMGKGPITVFAPNNFAIARMDPDMMSELAHNPIQERLFVKYHMVEGLILIPSIEGYDHLMSSAGQKIDVIHIGHSLILNNHTRVDSPPNNDIVCSNGVVQPIASVLIPPEYSADNIAAVLIKNDDQFEEFFMSILLTNLTQIVESGEYTVFAPINAAYAPFANNIFHPKFSLERRMEAMHEIVKYHLVPGVRYYENFRHGQQLFTLHGTPLNVSILNSGMIVNSAHVLMPDIPAANGVVHSIDHVLFPRDLLQQLTNEYQAAHGNSNP